VAYLHVVFVANPMDQHTASSASSERRSHRTHKHTLSTTAAHADWPTDCSHSLPLPAPPTT